MNQLWIWVVGATVITMLILFGIVFVFFYKEYEKYTRQMEIIQKRSDELHKVVGALIPSIEIEVNTIRVLESNLYRVINRVFEEDKKYKDNLLNELKEYHRESERCLHELKLHSPEPRERITAYQQLSAELGNAETLERLRELQPKDEKETGLLRTCREELAVRLETDT
ncbi:MAG: hypothetical protein GY862_02560 [Gammaproteobacteria bacterium]|nr:hypothetical protein [Gammaproteobacteria bacterium]